MFSRLNTLDPGRYKQVLPWGDEMRECSFNAVVRMCAVN